MSFMYIDCFEDYFAWNGAKKFSCNDLLKVLWCIIDGKKTVCYVNNLKEANLYIRELINIARFLNLDSELVYVKSSYKLIAKNKKRENGFIEFFSSGKSYKRYKKVDYYIVC